MAGPLFVCHMALLSGDHPRNSLGAIGECFEAAVERIEIDIHSLDGADYAVLHDARLDEITTGHGSVGRTTPDAFRAVRFAADLSGRPPLLSEVVELARGCTTEMQLDLKDWRPLTPERLRALSQVPEPVKQRVIVSSGQDWNLRLLHRFDPEIRYGFDPGHYIDHAVEGDVIFLPRALGAYGYRDDHPLASGRSGPTVAYLRERMELLVMQAPGAREWFLSYRLVLQMLDDGFNPAAFLHERGVDANVWTPDYHGVESITMLRRLIEAGIDRVTTNTRTAWQEALRPAAAS
jgi:glycerophosphoryl diester phosphodiesterase